MLELPKFHIHWWNVVSAAGRPGRSDWSCTLRRCRCGTIQYGSFGVFGTGTWHDIYDPEGCQDSEFIHIHSAAVYQGWSLQKEKLAYRQLWTTSSDYSKLIRDIDLLSMRKALKSQALKRILEKAEIVTTGTTTKKVTLSEDQLGALLKEVLGMPDADVEFEFGQVFNGATLTETQKF